MEFWPLCILLGIVFALLVLEYYCHITFLRFIIPIFEEMPLFTVPKSANETEGEAVSFPTTDGLTLRGSLYLPEGNPPRGVILFCPELGGSHKLALHYCGALYEAGYAILAFDFRNQGESDHLTGFQPLHWLTTSEAEDTQAALNYLQQRPDLRDLGVGVFGVSRGGTAALRLAAEHDVIQTVVCDSTYSTDSMMLYFSRRWGKLYTADWLIDILPDFHLRWTMTLARTITQRKKGCRFVRLEQWLPKLQKKPVFLISGKRDSYVQAKITTGLQEKIGSTCETWIVPKAKHNMARATAADQYDQILLERFCVLDPQPETLPTPEPVKIAG